MARDPRSQSLMPERMRWGTLSEAREATGLHYVTLKRRIAAGEIRTRVIHGRGNLGVLVDMDSIREQQLTKYPPVSTRDAAPAVGVSICTLKELRASGVMEERHHSGFRAIFAREDVDAFARKMDVLREGRKAVRTPGVITLDQAFHAWTASPKEKAAFLARLLDDPALVVGKRRGKGVGRLQVESAVFSRIFETLRAGEVACISVVRTAERLGCTAATVASLKRSGHIKTRRRIGRDMPCLDSVNAFHKSYEALAVTASHFGLRTNTARALLDLEALCYIKVQTTQNSTIFVHRCDLPKVATMLGVSNSRDSIVRKKKV